MLQTGSDFSGVGAFDQALIRLGIPYKTIFACDMDRFARQTYIHNYGMPDYFPENVYDREIPKEPLDIYVTTPPCQAFSLSGKRGGEKDKRGILFYNSHEFIQKNKPRYFIFENVKGLLSDDSGKTFQRWIDMLGGKSVNGNPMIFPHEDSVPYHVYWKVLNAKDYNVPQNRERVFIVGIRDDGDIGFNWPKPERLTKNIKDILEDNVNEKYFLSEKMLNDILDTSHLGCDRVKIIGNVNPSGNGMNGNVFSDEGILPTLTTNKGEGMKILSNTKKGYEIAYPGDSINFSQPNSETRRGRVGKEVLQTLDTACNQGILIPSAPIVEMQLTGGKWDKTHEQSGRVYHKEGILPTIHTMGGGNQEPKIIQGFRVRKITPREAFRGMDFPDSFTWPVSDSQAYKQAGNSVVVKMFELIIKNLLKQ